MAVVANRRSVMTLFSDSTDIESHRVRIVLAEKGINVEIVDVKPDEKPEDLIDLNPYNTVPTLVDRDLVLYAPQVIMEYLDERFPHPPLMPVDPVSRAQMRLMLYRIKKDWDSVMETILTASGKEQEQARKGLRESLTAVAPVFDQKPFFLSDEFSLVDCATSALLWRLPSLGIELPAQAKALIEYGERMFERESFIQSLTETEKEMR
ncbi:MAG: stringent starvation protein A [Gammaproteobacteria bacterium]|nr:stringent starvation protein A [Gammaproteobacteria bacterium]